MSRAVLFAGLLGLIGCADRQPGTAGRISLHWNGGDSGRMRFPATAVWCAADSSVQILGIEGDSGAALELFPSDTLQTGEYPVGTPGQPGDRPRAGLALRRFGENMVIGYYSTAGAIRLDSVARLTGSIHATLQNMTTALPVNLTGAFQEIPLASDSSCRPAPAPGAPSDSGVR